MLTAELYSYQPGKILLKAIDYLDILQLFQNNIWLKPNISLYRGKWPDDKFCHAIRRDLKVADDTPYVMSVKFNNLSGKRCEGVVSKVCGNIGLIFNFWDYTNYDFIYKGYSKQRVPTEYRATDILFFASKGQLLMTTYFIHDSITEVYHSPLEIF